MYIIIYIAYCTLCIQLTVCIYRATLYFHYTNTVLVPGFLSGGVITRADFQTFSSNLQPTRIDSLSTVNDRSAHARGSRGRSKHHPGCFPRRLPRFAARRLKLTPGERRDAGYLSPPRALPFRFLAVTTLVATLCRRRAHVQGPFHLLLFSWPWRTSRRGL